jgi:carbamoyl-phosphate synthase/aspartate carbamoyltransferase/dihydroorotase
MPNNDPPVVTRQRFEDKLARLKAGARVDYGAFVGYAGGDVGYLEEVAPQAAALKLYMDQTFGGLTLADEAVLAPVFEAWPGPGPIAIHGESDSIRLALALGEQYRQHVHICHVPHPDDLVAIENARQRGVHATCEVTPHHLFMTSEDASRLGAYGQMKPPLVPPDAVEAFWKRLDLVDAIASDHAPHTRAEKESDAPPPGVPGLETTLPLMLTAVRQGRLTLERMIALTHTGPLAVYGLQAPADSQIMVRLGEPYRLPAEGYHTRAGWSPFAGLPVEGRLLQVTLRGRVVWQEGQALAQMGQGRPLRRKETAQ